MAGGLFLLPAVQPGDMEVTNRGGRPSKYDPKFVDKIGEYLKSVGREQTRLPKRVDIALLLDVNDETLIEWEKIHPEFSATMSRVDQLQHSQLVDDGVYGGKEVNPQIVKLLLYNHGYREKSDVTSADEKIDGLVIVKDGSQIE